MQESELHFAQTINEDKNIRILTIQNIPDIWERTEQSGIIPLTPFLKKRSYGQKRAISRKVTAHQNGALSTTSPCKG